MTGEHVDLSALAWDVNSEIMRKYIGDFDFSDGDYSDTRIKFFLYINFKLIILCSRTDEGQVLARTGTGPGLLRARSKKIGLDLAWTGLRTV